MWTSNDKVWLKENYPSLKKKSSSIIEGSLSFQALLLKGQLIINPSIDQIQQTTVKDYLYICDTYEIRIEWKKQGEPPAAFEIGGRLANEAKRLGKNLLDMHQFPQTEALCLASPMELHRRNGAHLDVFVEVFIVPYLFAQSHYAKKQVWLWGELSHGFWGLLQWLGRRSRYDDKETEETYQNLWSQGDEEEIKRLLADRYRNFRPCVCGSGLRIRNCHPEIQVAISRIRGCISRGVITKTYSGRH